MKPKIPNPKYPWQVDPEQLKDLDTHILNSFPNAKLGEGIKYARWAEIPEEDFLRGPIKPLLDEYLCDQCFDGPVFGKNKIILMWLPFFE